MGVPHPETVGQWLKPGKPFCEVGDPHQLEAHLILDQSRHRPDPRSAAAPGSRSTATPRRPTRARSPRSPSGTATRSRPSSPTSPAARSPTKPDPKTGADQAPDRRLRGDHPDRQPRPDAPARPPRLRQDRRRHPHARLVALAADHQDVPLHDLTATRRREPDVTIPTARVQVIETFARAFSFARGPAVRTATRPRPEPSRGVPAHSRSRTNAATRRARPDRPRAPEPRSSQDASASRSARAGAAQRASTRPAISRRRERPADASGHRDPRVRIVGPGDRSEWSAARRCPERPQLTAAALAGLTA